ncbi:MAG: hypothetical protein KJ604_20330, partial [Gammaproteobacteria bacterium]|nr:hypothetical protein [Gammaproteobacteria bacterium]
NLYTKRRIIMSLKIWVDHYEYDNTDIVFVNGYALKERYITIAYDLAKANGQKTLVTKVYPIQGVPYKMEYEV